MKVSHEAVSSFIFCITMGSFSLYLAESTCLQFHFDIFQVVLQRKMQVYQHQTKVLAVTSKKIQVVTLPATQHYRTLQVIFQRKAVGDQVLGQTLCATLR